jgi:hypothetical protein
MENTSPSKSESPEPKNPKLDTDVQKVVTDILSEVVNNVHGDDSLLQLDGMAEDEVKAPSEDHQPLLEPVEAAKEVTESTAIEPRPSMSKEASAESRVIFA